MRNDGHSLMRAAGAACLASMLAHVPASNAEFTPLKGVVDSRVRTAPYDKEQVYRLHGFVGYQIDLEFETGETFVGLGAGDIEGVAYVGQDNHLFLKPRAAKVATNLTVITSRRHYQFDYSVMSGRPGSDAADALFALRFVYPAPRSEAVDAAARLDAELRGASTARAQNFDYWYCGDDGLRPIFAADDRVHTRLRFAAGAELPAVFVRNDDGGESLLNYSMEGGDLILHRIAPRFVLRRGKSVGCVVNRSFDGGVRLESGTVTPTVERRVQGSEP